MAYISTSIEKPTKAQVAILTKNVNLKSRKVFLKNELGGLVGRRPTIFTILCTSSCDVVRGRQLLRSFSCHRLRLLLLVLCYLALVASGRRIPAVSLTAHLCLPYEEEEDFAQTATVRCEGAYPFYAAVSQRGLTAIKLTYDGQRC